MRNSGAGGGPWEVYVQQRRSIGVSGVNPVTNVDFKLNYGAMASGRLTDADTGLLSPVWKRAGRDHRSQRRPWYPSEPREWPNRTARQHGMTQRDMRQQTGQPTFSWGEGVKPWRPWEMVSTTAGVVPRGSLDWRAHGGHCRCGGPAAGGCSPCGRNPRCWRATSSVARVLKYISGIFLTPQGVARLAESVMQSATGSKVRTRIGQG